jgi:hypothetical protein
MRAYPQVISQCAADARRVLDGAGATFRICRITLVNKTKKISIPVRAGNDPASREVADPKNTAN